MPILGRSYDKDDVKDALTRFGPKQTAPAQQVAVPDDVYTITVGAASITLKKDGTIELRGKDISLIASGEIEIKASRDVQIKGAKIREN